MKDLFASDYGEVSRDFFSVGYVSNAAELIRGEETYRLLRLCGLEGCERGELLSDWELFFSFCKAYPLLRGHLAAERKCAILRAYTDAALPFSEETAEALWRKSTECFSDAPLLASALLQREVPWLCDGQELPENLPDSLPVVLSADFLAARTGERYGDWHARILSVTERFSSAHCVGVLLRIPSDFSFEEPNIYAVGEALAGRRERGASGLLLSQLAREVSAACALHRLPLLVEFSCGRAAAALLRYEHRSVGLGELCVSARMPEARDALLDFATEKSIRIALRLPDVPTESEMEAAVESMAARYPIGRVRLITGADLRESGEAQTRAEDLLCRIIEKKL